MVVATGRNKAYLHFVNDDNNRECFSLDFIKDNPTSNPSDPQAYLYFKASPGRPIPRLDSRYIYTLENGKTSRSQGDHILSFGVLYRIINELVFNISLSECEKIIAEILNPLVKSLYNSNRTFCDENILQLKVVAGFKVFENNFTKQFDTIQDVLEDDILSINYRNKIEQEKMKQGANVKLYCDVLSDYLNITYIFFHNLPIAVISDGPYAGRSNTEKEGINLFEEISEKNIKTLSRRNLDDLGRALFLTMDIKALKKLIAFATRESYSAIINHLAGLALLACASVIKINAENMAQELKITYPE